MPRPGGGTFARFLILLLALVLADSVLFRLLMQAEGQSPSWVTSVYWTLTVMTTLGFGDITFQSDAGRLLSIAVLLSGVVLMLVLLPFTFIQHFYLPWLEASKRERVPHGVPPGTRGHVVIVGTDSLSTTLADDLRAYGVPTVILAPDPQSTGALIEQGHDAVLGAHDDPATYRRLGLDRAAMLVAMESDQRNSNIVHTAHLASPGTPVVARAESDAAVDILRLAGASRAYRFHDLLGRALARRVLNPARPSSTIATFGELVIAEAPVMRTPLVGRTVAEAALRRLTGVNIVGMWERGRFTLPRAGTRLTEASVIVTAGTAGQTTSLDAYLRDSKTGPDDAPRGGVLVVGAGRVGRAAAEFLGRQSIGAVLVDRRDAGAAAAPGGFVRGDAAELEVLEAAGIRTASSVVITPNDGDANIYLTIYCRHLRPDIQIISRAASARDVESLHAAGADLVLSLPTMIGNALMNMISPGRVMVLNESLSIFRAPLPGRLAGTRLDGSGIRERSNCSVVAIGGGGHSLILNPPPDYAFAEGEELYLIGDSAAEASFNARFAG